MLNKDKIRELAYVVLIDNITPIEGYDRVELAHVGGWTIVVGKENFKPGDPAIYFEIDSKLPEVEPFTNMEFLVKKKYKVKTQKMCKSISQGLLLSAADLGWLKGENIDINSTIHKGIFDKNGNFHSVDNESRFLTELLGVTYAVAADNKRKAKSIDKYKKMAQRNEKLFSHQPFKWLMKKTWGKKLLFIFFGKRKDKKGGWPEWIQKTDEERIQNMLYILEDKEPWIATEKIDGTSTTFSLKRGKRFKNDEFYICSRNVVFDKPDKTCFYDINVYIEMAKKYNIYSKMKNLLNTYFSDCDWITIQGETYGPTVQKRDYHATERCFMAFNFITSKDGRWNSIKMRDLLEYECGIPCVPILDESFILPDTIDELMEYTDNETSRLDNDLREGIVFRSLDGKKSFKYVSPNYLIKFH